MRHRDGDHGAGRSRCCLDASQYALAHPAHSPLERNDLSALDERRRLHLRLHNPSAASWHCDRALQASGLTSEPLGLLYNTRAVVIAMVYVLLPLAILPLYATFARIDDDLVLAAESLGASRIRALTSIVLALALPDSLRAAHSCSSSEWASTSRQRYLDRRRSPFLGSRIADQVGDEFDVPAAAAGSSILLLIALDPRRSRPHRGSAAPSADARMIARITRLAHAIAIATIALFLLGPIVLVLILLSRTTRSSPFRRRAGACGSIKRCCSRRSGRCPSSTRSRSPPRWLLVAMIGSCAVIALARTRIPGRGLLLAVAVGPLVVPEWCMRSGRGRPSAILV